MWKQNASTFMRKVQKGTESECWIWTGKKPWKYGYGKCKFQGRNQFVHRVSYQLFVGPIPDDRPIIRHRCDNPSCVNPNHLIAGTVQDNINDRNERNRQTKGEKIHTAKLTAAQVEEMRKSYIPYQVTLRMLSERYGVSLDQVHRIVRFKQWR